MNKEMVVDMHYLMINKFLYPNGGSETYMFKLGEYFESIGWQVQYFGMEHEERCVGNNAQSYTKNMDFHGKNPLVKLTYPLKTIYSVDSRKKIRKVLDDFKPDVCHLNNFNYQLTPSIIEEIVKWRKKNKRECRIIYTAHDYQLICPNHMMRTCNNNCEACVDGHFLNCTKNKCIHGSFFKSVIGSMEAIYWNKKGTYKYIDNVICPSEFMKTKMDTNSVFKNKTVVIHNFIAATDTKIKQDKNFAETVKREKYILYFGRFSSEKGFDTMLNVAQKLNDINFVFAGKGPLEKKLEESIKKYKNIEYVGFMTGNNLQELINNAVCSVYPSEWYENCPLSVMESISLGTPVIGANIGGIPELIDSNKTGILFESGNEEMLSDSIKTMWNAAINDSNDHEYTKYKNYCNEKKWLDEKQYTDIYMKVLKK